MAKTETVRFRATPKDVRRLDQIAVQAGLSRSSVLRALIHAAEVTHVEPLRIQPLDAQPVKSYTEKLPKQHAGG